MWWMDVQRGVGGCLRERRAVREPVLETRSECTGDRQWVGSPSLGESAPGNGILMTSLPSVCPEGWAGVSVDTTPVRGGRVLPDA